MACSCEASDHLCAPACTAPRCRRSAPAYGRRSRCSFFFSSRRRHTRLQGDWSSDVCSSDLARPILSHSTVSAVESAFNSLANTVLSNNARTLEDLVKEMLRPMLKSWLDDNLPGLVERIVKAEIERVSRGGR